MSQQRTCVGEIRDCSMGKGVVLQGVGKDELWGQCGPRRAPHTPSEFLGCFASLGYSDKLPPTAPQSRLGSSWGCGGWQGAGMEPSDHVHIPQSYSTWSHCCCAGTRRAVWGPWGLDRCCPGLNGSLCDTQGGHVHVPTLGRAVD